MEEMTERSTSQHGSQQGQFAAKSFDARFARIMKATAASSESVLARILEINPSSVASAKKRKQLPPGWIEQISDKFGVSSDWLFFGTGTMKPGEVCIASPQELSSPTKAEPPPSADDFKMSEMVTMTVEVLESETIYRTALASNIRAFHQAVRSERTLARIEERMDVFEKEMEQLRRENRELKQYQENLSQSKAVGADG